MAARTDHHDDALLALLYDELPPAEAEALRKELAAEAPEVLDRLADYQHIREVAAELPELEPDPQMHYDLLRAARLAAEPDEKPSRFWALIESLSWTPAIAGLLLVVVAAGLTAQLSGQIGEGGTDAPAVALAPGAAPPAEKPQPARGEAAKGEAAKSAASPTPAEALDTKQVETATPDTAAEGALADPEAPADAPSAQPPAEVALDGARGRNTRAEAPADKIGDAFGGEAEKSAGGAEKASEAKTLGKMAPSKRDRAAEPPVTKKAAPRKVKSKLRSKRPPPVVTEQDAAPAKKGEARFAPPPPAPDYAAGADADGLDDADDLLAPSRAPAPAPGPAPTPQAAPSGAEPAAEDVALDAVGGAAPEPDRQADSLERRAAPSRAATDEVAEFADTRVEAEEESAPAVQAQAASPSAVMLDRARAARANGQHRAAVDLYEEYLRENGSAAGADRVRYEAAQSYEAIGRADRAMQLYQQVAGGGGAFASASRTRMKALAATLADSPPAKQTAPARPARAIDFEAAEPAETRD